MDYGAVSPYPQRRYPSEANVAAAWVAYTCGAAVPSQGEQMTRKLMLRGAAAVAAGAYAVLGLVVSWKGTGEGEYANTYEYVIGYALVIAVLAVAVAVDLFRPRTKWGPLLARIGAGILAVGVMWGNLTGAELAWFAALGIPGNLLLFAGCLVIARALWPDGGRTRVFAVLLALSQPLALAGAEIGGGFVASAAWLIIAVGLVGATPRLTQDAQTPPVTA
jgi:hypothetical protein